MSHTSAPAEGKFCIPMFGPSVLPQSMTSEQCFGNSFLPTPSRFLSTNLIIAVTLLQFGSCASADMELLTTSHGKPCAHYKGYSHIIKRSLLDGTVVWRCSKQRSKQCRGMLKTRDTNVLTSNDHNCGPPDDARLEVQKAVTKANKRAREEDTPISKVYSEEFGDLHNRGYNFVTEMPEQQVTKRTLYNQRAKSQGNQKEPKLSQEISLQAEELTMSDGTSFLFSDDESAERIIIFCGKSGTEVLKSKQDFFMDGTFKSCSKQFTQIYTVHADFESSKEETNIYPVAFALLPNKKKQTYVRMFQSIVKIIPEWKPRNVTVDFEAAVISALEEVFPSVEIHGCYFHMKKCLWRKIQDLGLTCVYREDEEVQLQVRMCAALAFLRPEDVADGWAEIHSHASNAPRLTEFFDYFVERWLENAEIPINLWTCYGRRHRTTNAVEGWHNKNNNLLGKPNPKIKDVIDCMKKEAENSASLFMRSELNMEGKRRKKKYMKLDERLEKTVKKYEEDGDIRTCLRMISHLQKLE